MSTLPGLPGTDPTANNSSSRSTPEAVPGAAQRAQPAPPVAVPQARPVTAVQIEQAASQARASSVNPLDKFVAVPSPPGPPPTRVPAGQGVPSTSNLGYPVPGLDELRPTPLVNPLDAARERGPR